MTVKKQYLLSLGAIVLASAYPLYMGVSAFLAYLRDGGIMADQYPRYIIPYTPICLALILAVGLMPLLFRWLKRYAIAAASGIGVATFLAAESLFEGIMIIVDYVPVLGADGVPLQFWQMGLCRSLTEEEAMQIVTSPVVVENSFLFKAHFYLISILMVLAVIGVVYGFSRMLREGDKGRRVPLTAQLVAVTAYIGLCIWACFTAFYRTGEIEVSAISAILMCVFFVVFGMTAGIYTGTLLYRKKPFLSCWIPAVIASLITVAMYIGELFVMDGALFVLGSSTLFQPLAGMPFAIFDFFIMLLSGGLTYLTLWLLRKERFNA